MKKMLLVLLTLILCIGTAALAETPSVLTQEQYDLVDVWFSQVSEIVPASTANPTITGCKFLIALKVPGVGIYTSLPDDGIELDMSCFPQENLAETFEEADTLIMIYPVYKVVGQYLGSAVPVSARKTYTTICVADIRSGMLGIPFYAIVRDPPKSVNIQTQNGIPMRNAYNGDFEPQIALEKASGWLSITDTVETDLKETLLFPEELAGEWYGTGIPKNDSTMIDLAVSIQKDGTGSYTFIQGDYTENYPFTISATDNTFSVDIPVTAQFGKVEGTWTMEDGRLMLDITATFVNGRTYSYTAACSRSEDDLPDDDSNAVVKAGDTIFFGNYPQNAKDTMEPIEWLVLETDGNKALLLSLYGLDGGNYDGFNYREEITWEQCSIRSVLNSTFLESAFTAEQQAAILLTNVDNSRAQGYPEWDVDGGNDTQDQIFLLSYSEVNKYFDVEYDKHNNMKATVHPTEYAKTKSCGYILKSTSRGEKKNEYGDWLLRSPGKTQADASHVGIGGEFHSCKSFEANLIRPAMWLDLSRIQQETEN